VGHPIEFTIIDKAIRRTLMIYGTPVRSDPHEYRTFHLSEVVCSPVDRVQEVCAVSNRTLSSTNRPQSVKEPSEHHFAAAAAVIDWSLQLVLAIL
jgi:hypothetical protein